MINTLKCLSYAFVTVRNIINDLMQCLLVLRIVYLVKKKDGEVFEI